MTESQHDFQIRKYVQSCDEAIESGESRWDALYRLARNAYEYGSLTSQERREALEAAFAREGIGPEKLGHMLGATGGRRLPPPERKKWWKF